MSSGDESDANDIISERETQFVPRSDDDEVLWEVQEITAERGRKYKVKWVGIDPATRKPWAQSWVAKHDCTDKLVAEWKAKKRRLESNKVRRGGRTSTTSRASSAARRTGSSTSGRKTRPSPRPDSAEQEPSQSKKTTTKGKRKRVSPAPTGSPDVQEDEEDLRPHKKLKVLEALLAPVSEDEDEALFVTSAEARAKGALQVEAKDPAKRGGALGDGSEEEEGSPRKGRDDVKGKSVQCSEARSERDGSRVSRPRMKTAVVIPRRDRVAKEVRLFEDEGRAPSTSRKSSTAEHRSPSKPDEQLPVVELVLPIKIGPPRGAKRREKSRESGTSSNHGLLRTKSREDKSAERVHAEKPKSHSHHEANPPGGPLLVQQGAAGGRISISPRISISLVSPSIRPRNPELSPGARARLEIFDRMMVEASKPDAGPSADVSERVPEDTQFNYDDDHDTIDTFNLPRPPSPPPSASKPKHPKPIMSNGLVVPESETSGNSQSQQESLLKSPHRQPDLPTIAVITASASPSSVSSQNLVPAQRILSFAIRPPKGRVLKPVPQISPDTFRSSIVRSQAPDSEAPPSSIESFGTPKRVDKGKQRVIEEEEDQLDSSLPEVEGDGHRKGMTQSKATDSELKRRGKQLFEEALQKREIERQKKIKAKRLKTVSDIVNGAASLPFMGKDLPPIEEMEDALPLQCDDVVDLSGGANSTTLDSPEHSEAKPMSEEEKERLRIELRQEEEESTLEAMGVYPPRPPQGSEAADGGNIPMQPSESPKDCGQAEESDHVEQPSADLQLVSVIVQASQEQRHEDTDTEPLLSNQPASSPPRKIPENLTDSPKRRLGEALSLLNVKSEEIQRLEHELADEHKNVRDSKTELADIRKSLESTNAALTTFEAERGQWLQERSKLESNSAMWETQREEWHQEKVTLLARVTELSDTAVRADEMKAKLSELEAERVAWTQERDELLNKLAQRPEESAIVDKVSKEHEQERVKWESERVLWVEERAKWETERAALQEKQEALSRSVGELTAKVASATAAKVSADKDMEFFREQYAQASAFVDSVRDENLELEKRVKIAEGQAQEGVAAIKAVFEGRVKALQADIDRWKGLTELLQEKDRRTNDEIRCLAAQTPDLMDLCDRLRTENQSLEVDLRKLGQTHQRTTHQRRKLYYEIYVLKRERVSLKSKLSRLVKATESSSQELGMSHSAPAPPTPQDPEDMDPNDMMTLPDPPTESSYGSNEEPAWFPCMWRPQWRDQCQHVFDAKEDLERHLQQHYRDLSTAQ